MLAHEEFMLSQVEKCVSGDDLHMFATADGDGLFRAMRPA